MADELPKKEFLVMLEAPGNPDMRQFAPLAAPESHRVSTLAEAQVHCLRYKTVHDLGGGNWGGSCGKVYRAIGTWSLLVGHFSYNMRFWRVKGRNLAKMPGPEIAGMRWVMEFGVNYDIPEELLALVRDETFMDESWHNDVYPSFTRTDLGEYEFESCYAPRIWVAPPKVEDREDPSNKRYSVVDDKHETLCETEDVTEAVKALLAYKVPEGMLKRGEEPEVRQIRAKIVPPPHDHKWFECPGCLRDYENINEEEVWPTAEEGTDRIVDACETCRSDFAAEHGDIINADIVAPEIFTKLWDFMREQMSAGHLRSSEPAIQNLPKIKETNEETTALVEPSGT